MAKLALAGVTAKETSPGGGAGTVSVAVLLTPLRDAVMVVDPAATPVARPEALMVATAGAVDVHEAVAVAFAVELSL
jgi:hypothetical protein